MSALHAEMPRVRKTLAGAVILIALLAACKAPRSPREAATGKLTGRWTAESTAIGPPVDTGLVQWALELEHGQAGKLVGRGAMAHRGSREAFSLAGLRGESEIQLKFELRGQRVRYHGGIVDVRTIVGEMYLPDDTIAVTFTRE